ncbi:MAG TPA: CPBP family intramembrane glutamic endopeptidase [Solirubrobacteraceae bacterium]|nr:CPBP family intramembrane glutamic endopeptidase [Solirubrobacteraceae bacterium]
MATETDEPHSRPPYWAAIAAVLLGLAAGFFAQVLTELVGTALGSPSGHPTPAVYIVSNFAFDAAFVGAALYFSAVGRWMGRREFGYVGTSWRLGAGAVVLAAVAYYLVTLAYSAVFRLHGTDRLPSSLGVHRSVWAAAFTALFVCAVAPMAEEFFFRGFLFGILRRMSLRVGRGELGPWVAAVIVGLLFGLAHFDSAQPEFLIPLGFLGFVLCLVRWRTGSLYPGMVLHSINNSVAFAANEHLGWSPVEVAALLLGSLALIAVVTGPLAVRREGVRA